MSEAKKDLRSDDDELELVGRTPYALATIASALGIPFAGEVVQR